MNHDTKLKLQAYFDNELSDREARAVAEMLERDSEARALCSELGDIRTALRANEPEVKVPESREFYWSKIERAIRDSERQAEEHRPAKLWLAGRSWWMRVVAPALGAALVVMSTVSVLKYSHNSKLSYLHEIETPRQDMVAMSFHSQSDGMTVVWVQSRVY